MTRAEYAGVEKSMEENGMARWEGGDSHVTRLVGPYVPCAMMRIMDFILMVGCGEPLKGFKKSNNILVLYLRKIALNRKP